MPDHHSDFDQNSARAHAGDGVRVVTKVSPWSVADTVARLSTVVTGRGMTVFTVIDHSGEAEALGLELRDTKVVIFGSPQAGTPVMQAAPLAALDLPLQCAGSANAMGSWRFYCASSRCLRSRS